MIFKDIIRAAIKDTGTTQQKLADAMGYSHGQANISKILSRGDIFASTFVRLMDKLGYDVVVQPRDPSKPKYTLKGE